VYLLYDGVCKAGDAKYNTDADCTALLHGVASSSNPRKIIFKAAELSQDCPSLTTNDCGEHAQHSCVVKKLTTKSHFTISQYFLEQFLAMSKL